MGCTTFLHTPWLFQVMDSGNPPSQHSSVVSHTAKLFLKPTGWWLNIENNFRRIFSFYTLSCASNLPLKWFHIFCIREVFRKLITILLFKQDNEALFSEVSNTKPQKIQNSARIPLVWLQNFGLWCCQCKCMVFAWQKSEHSSMKASNLLCDTIMRFSSDGPLQQSLWMGELSNVSSIASKYT